MNKNSNLNHELLDVHQTIQMKGAKKAIGSRKTTIGQSPLPKKTLELSRGQPQMAMKT